MKNVIRWILGFPVAALVTVGLFVLMMTLIAEEFKPQEKLATASFDINPTVEDIKVIKRDTKVKQVKKLLRHHHHQLLKGSKLLNLKNV